MTDPQGTTQAAAPEKQEKKLSPTEKFALLEENVNRMGIRLLALQNDLNRRRLPAIDEQFAVLNERMGYLESTLAAVVEAVGQPKVQEIVTRNYNEEKAEAERTAKENIANGVKEGHLRPSEAVESTSVIEFKELAPPKEGETEPAVLNGYLQLLMSKQPAPFTEVMMGKKVGDRVVVPGGKNGNSLEILGIYHIETPSEKAAAVADAHAVPQGVMATDVSAATATPEGDVVLELKDPPAAEPQPVPSDDGTETVQSETEEAAGK